MITMHEKKKKWNNEHVKLGSHTTTPPFRVALILRNEHRIHAAALAVEQWNVKMECYDGMLHNKPILSVPIIRNIKKKYFIVKKNLQKLQKFKT